jgi:hypothetical protein
MIAIEALLATIAAAAERREPLPAALRASGVRWAEAVAARLDAGDDLPTALSGLVSPELAQLLAGPRPPLEHAALLGAATLANQRQGRALVLDLLAWPVVCLIAASAALGTVAGPLGLPLDGRWLWLLIPGLIIGLVPVAGWRFEALCHHLPWLCGWALHTRRAWRYERAALAARWRLDETDLDRLGTDLRQLGPILGRPEAEAHCQRLAQWHRTAATNARQRLGQIGAALLLIMAGALILAAAGGPLQQAIGTVVENAAEDIAR